MHTNWLKVDRKTSECESTNVSLCSLGVCVWVCVLPWELITVPIIVYGFDVLLYETLPFQFQSLDDAAAATAVVNGMCNYSRAKWLQSQALCVRRIVISLNGCQVQMWRIECFGQSNTKCKKVKQCNATMSVNRYTSIWGIFESNYIEQQI